MLPHFRVGSPPRRPSPGQGPAAASSSLQLLSCWAQLWALGVDSEIPVGFVWADYSQQRNDIHSAGLSRNCLQLEPSLSRGPLTGSQAASGGLATLRENAAFRVAGGHQEGRVRPRVLLWLVTGDSLLSALLASSRSLSSSTPSQSRGESRMQDSRSDGYEQRPAPSSKGCLTLTPPSHRASGQCCRGFISLPPPSNPVAWA